MKLCQNIFLFFLAFSSALFVELMSGSISRGGMTTIERQFQVDTKQVSSLPVFYTSCKLPLILVSSYLGRKYSRPRLIGIGLMVDTLGLFIASLPHFITGTYDYRGRVNVHNITGNVTEVCRNISSSLLQTKGECDVVSAKENENKTVISSLFWIMYLAHGLMGSGSSVLFPLGYSYIDDHTNKYKSALYIALANVMLQAGNAAGFALSGTVFKLWVDFESIDTETIDINPEDPRWIGAWWLGYLICGCLMSFISISFFFFPRSMESRQSVHLPEEAEGLNRAEEAKTTEESTGTDIAAKSINAARTTASFKDVIEIFLRLAKTPVYVWVAVIALFTGGAVYSFILFSPKYLEVMFGLSASETNYVVGAAFFPCTLLGTVSSGYIMKRYKLERRGIIRLVLTGLAWTVAFLISLLLIGCQTIDIRGVTVPYVNETLRDNKHDEIVPCNEGCNCDVGSYSPVCGDDGVTYLSGCFAGCLDVNTSQETNEQISTLHRTYSHCACVNSTGDGEAYEGKCVNSKCPHLLLAVVLATALATLGVSIVITPTTVLILRSVPADDKSIGIGVSTCVVRILGVVPCQMILAVIIDTACLYWSRGNCDTGYCKIYDNQLFRERFMGSMLFIASMITLSSILASFYEWRERVKNRCGWFT